MLLIDGVKYVEWTPTSEGEFERIVEDHAKDIFGEQSIYLEKHRLRTKSGIGSIPDGYVIVFRDQPQWHIIEVELSTHPLYEHIVPQISKFINGIKNPSTQRDIVDTLYREIDSDDFLKLCLKKAIGTTETYKFLSDLLSKSPVVTIIIEKRTEQLDEAIGALAHSQIKVVEFQTFTREGIDLGVHAHLFEPLYKSVVAIEPQPSITPAETVDIVLAPSCMKYYYIHIPAAKKHLFPTFKTTLALETDIGPIKSGFGTDPAWGAWLQKGLSVWFKKHPELKPGDKLIIEVIEPMKRYSLKIA
jgi:hypothetical protein